jgi:hypothetical protein
VLAVIMDAFSTTDKKEYERKLVMALEEIN